MSAKTEPVPTQLNVSLYSDDETQAAKCLSGETQATPPADEPATNCASNSSSVVVEQPAPRTPSETPRTDFCVSCNTGNGTEWIRADFARTLERELAAKDAEIASLKSLAKGWDAAYAEAIIAADNGDLLPICTAMLKYYKTLERKIAAARELIERADTEAIHDRPFEVHELLKQALAELWAR